MDLEKLTFDEFLCGNAEIRKDSLPLAFQGLKDELLHDIGEKVRDVEQFALHRMKSDQGDVVLLYQGEVAGYYVGEALAIDDKFRCRGLSIPLILEAVKHRPPPTKRQMTEAGKAALTKAWRVANGELPNPWP